MWSPSTAISLGEIMSYSLKLLIVVGMSSGVKTPPNKVVIASMNIKIYLPTMIDKPIILIAAPITLSLVNLCSRAWNVQLNDSVIFNISVLVTLKTYSLW
jgi:hypothetical protein